ncbi:MAG: EAL domain-containing protein [Thermodesulfobacteriota bacterium]
MKIEKLFFWLLIVFYIITVSFMTVKDYTSAKRERLEKIDSKLYTAAQALDTILGKDFHDRYDLKNPISNEKYDKIVEKLNRFVDNLNIEYVYSMAKHDGYFYFIVSNETEEDKKRKTYSLFYNLYFDPPEDVKKAYNQNKTVFSSKYTNTWDSFRSVFIPKTTDENFRYILAADIKTKDLKKILNRTILKSFLKGLVFILPIIPAFFLMKRISKNREKELLQRIYNDSLTGFPNRNRFIRDSSTLCNSWIIGVIFDIDSFREINDLFGGDIGDELLKDVADIIQRNLSDEDLLYKFPADEYLVIFKRKQLKSVEQITREILDQVSLSNFDKTGKEISITMSAGITEEIENYKKLLSTSNIAKNRAKQLNKGAVIYNKELRQEKKFKDNLYWLNELKIAIDEGRIVPFFQPIKNNRTGRIDKYEALIRLLQKDGSIISPFKFLDVAKKSKLYPELTKTVILKAFQTFSGTRDIKVAINFTTSDFLNIDTMNYLKEMVKKYSMKDKVIAEIVESESVNEHTEIFGLVDDLKTAGIKIAIDDFGSGYSNFEYLLKLKSDIIKIDGSLIKNILKDENSRLIVKAIISFAEQMNLEIVAEFVSDPEIQKEIEKYNIDYSQGFFIGKPEKF